jgi:hypothetical protein
MNERCPVVMTAVTRRFAPLSIAIAPPRLIGASSGWGETTRMRRPAGADRASTMKNPE